MKITIEITPGVFWRKCVDCDGDCASFKGLMYKDDDAHAMYFGKLHACRASSPSIPVACLAIGKGEYWQEDPKDQQVISITLQIWTEGPDYKYSIVDPDNSPWWNHPLLCKMLTREHVLGSGTLKDEFFHLAEHVVSDDRRVHEFLESGELPPEVRPTSEEEEAWVNE